MKIKYFDNTVREENVGIILEGEYAGCPNYYLIHDIKEIFIDGQWAPNPGYDLQKIKKQNISQIESQIIDISLRLDKANSLNLQTQISELTEKLTELNKQKGEINAL